MAALVVGGSASVSASADIGSPTASGKALRTYMDRGTRLTISMWDFSWLKAHHPGGAYEDLERRVAEAAERGYNTLRVDCFPSRIPEKESRFDKNWTRGVNLPQWGQTAVAFTCDVRKEVRELAYLCRKHGIWLGLDSWDKAHMFGHGSIFDKPAPAYTIAESDEEREFMRSAETWAKALKIMRDDGVLERAVWIAPMNEVPHFAGGGIAAIRDLNKRPLKDGETAQDKAQAAFAKATRNVKPGGVWERLEQIEFKAWSEAWDTACRKNYRQMIKRARGYHETCLKKHDPPLRQATDGDQYRALRPVLLAGPSRCRLGMVQAIQRGRAAGGGRPGHRRQQPLQLCRAAVHPLGRPRLALHVQRISAGDGLNLPSGTNPVALNRAMMGSRRLHACVLSNTDANPVERRRKACGYHCPPCSTLLQPASSHSPRG